MTSVGKLTLKKGHVLQSKYSGFSISPLLQQLMCLAGQSLVFSEASKTILNFLNVDVSAMQIQRVCKYYGGILSSLIKKNQTDYIPKLEHVKKEDKV